MITVHGRTRCQFYTGKADWAAIRAVREAVTVPLVANGDCQSAADAKAMMQASGADAVMIGRGAYGRPWWPAVVAEQLQAGTGCQPPSLPQELSIHLQQQDETLVLYGQALGNKTFRKHLGWAIGRLHERRLISDERVAQARAGLLPLADNAAVAAGLRAIYLEAAETGELAA